MALSEFDFNRCETMVAEFIEQRRPPPRLRKGVDLAFRMKKQSVEIFEIRPHWTGKGKPVEHRIAKAAFNERKRNWKVFWQRGDLKWRSYKPNPEVDSIEDFLSLLKTTIMAVFAVGDSNQHHWNV